jgi:pto-interacting protein 1
MLHGRRGAENAQPGPVLSWSQRVKIATGAAKGLEYLIKNAKASLFNYGITSSNVLLFKNCDVARIAATDLWNEFPNVSMHLSAVYEHMASGYCAPEIRKAEEVMDFGLVPLEELVHLPRFESLYEASGTSCTKSDIYSFGVVLLELLTGRKPADNKLPRGQKHLISWAIPKITKHEVKLCIDRRLKEEYHLESAKMIATVAESCLRYEADDRPDISTVVTLLQYLEAEL